MFTELCLEGEFADGSLFVGNPPAGNDRLEVSTINTWLEFWNAPQQLYVNRAHAARLYHQIAEELVLAAGIGPGDKCLDFGCGEALGCPVLLARGAEVLLYDGSERMCSLVRERFGDRSGVALLDATELEAIPAQSLDVVSVISVSQYLAVPELESWLARWRVQLRPGGCLVLGDVIPPNIGVFSDTMALLRHCWRNGHFLAALRSLAATLSSTYRTVATQTGLTRYSEAHLRALLEAHGFAVTRHPRNLGINQARMTLVVNLGDGPRGGAKNHIPIPGRTGNTTS